MKTRLKLGITALLVVLLSYAFHFAAWLLNVPNDLAVIGGLAGVILLFVLGPTLLWLVWRKKKEEKVNEPEEKPAA